MSGALFTIRSIQPLNTSWNWQQNNQSQVYFNGIKHQIFNLCLNNKENWRNYTGLPLGLSYGSLTAVSQICLIAEQLIKGLGNILGSLIPGSDFHLHIGCRQLNLASKNVIYFFIGCPIVAVRALFIIPIRTFFSPDLTRDSYTCTPCTPLDDSYFFDQNSFNEYEILPDFVL